MTIDISWDTFNVNQYDGVLVLPQGSDGTYEFIGGFKEGRSQDGHVTVGKSNSFGISSLNQMYWEISSLKNGVYKLYLFCRAGGSGSEEQWSRDVKATVTIDGKRYLFSPERSNGEVWEILFINGGTRQVEEKQVFYPFRHIIFVQTRDALTGALLPGVTVQLYDAVSGKPIPG